MSEVINITDANFQQVVIDSKILTVLDFGAEWCAPCKKLHPIMTEIAGEFNGRVKIGYVDVGAVPRIAQKYAVMSVPRLIFFKEGKPIETVIGLTLKPKIMEKIHSHL